MSWRISLVMFYIFVIVNSWKEENQQRTDPSNKDRLRSQDCSLILSTIDPNCCPKTILTHKWATTLHWQTCYLIMTIMGTSSLFSTPHMLFRSSRRSQKIFRERATHTFCLFVGCVDNTNIFFKHTWTRAVYRLKNYDTRTNTGTLESDANTSRVLATTELPTLPTDYLVLGYSGYTLKGIECPDWPSGAQG